MGLARREVKERVCECNPLLLVVVVVVVTAAAMMVGGGGEGKWVKSLGRELASLALPPPDVGRPTPGIKRGWALNLPRTKKSPR